MTYHSFEALLTFSPGRRMSPSHSPQRFATTHWSMVAQAARRSSPEAEQALARLCEMYWYPLYAYVRRRGYRVEEAQDLTQDFFARLLEKDHLEHADRQRGKFRTFLLSSLQHYLANEWRKAGAQKRGGGRAILSLDFASGEDRYRLEPADTWTPERIFERRWALTLMERALDRLRDEYDAAGKRELYEALKPQLGGEGPAVSYAEAGARLGMSEGAVKTAAHRLRRRCRELLQAEAAETLADPEDAQSELRELLHALGS
jgi:RNA polymerase sigma factor (sigma-70 family)